MTDIAIDSLKNIGASLKHIGGAIAETIRHKGSGSGTPTQPLDLALSTELPNLRREGQQSLVEALVSLRIEIGALDNA